MSTYTEGFGTIHNNYRVLIGRRKRIQPWEIQQKYLRKYGKLYSESTTTARLRQMKDVVCFKSKDQWYYTLAG